MIVLIGSSIPSNLMRRADRTRTCNLRFWRPLRYQLRHCPRVDRTQKLVCNLHQSPIIANEGQLDKSRCSMQDRIATWLRQSLVCDLSYYSTVNPDVCLSSCRGIPHRNAKAIYA